MDPEPKPVKANKSKSSCCVPLCNKPGYLVEDGVKVTFHCVPKDPNLLKRWLKKIKRDLSDNILISKHTKICSRHFRWQDFIVTPFKAHKILKRTAIPSIFPWSSDEEQVQTNYRAGSEVDVQNALESNSSSLFEMEGFIKEEKDDGYFNTDIDPGSLEKTDHVGSTESRGTGVTVTEDDQGDLHQNLQSAGGEFKNNKVNSSQKSKDGLFIASEPQSINKIRVHVSTMVSDKTGRSQDPSAHQSEDPVTGNRSKNDQDDLEDPYILPPTPPVIKKFKCNCCGKLFASKGSLDQHMRKYSGKKALTCDVCGKCFFHLGNLYRHQLTHTGEKPHVCEYCDKAFNQRTNLNTHKRRHHGDKPFKCEQCGKCFNLRIALNKHIKTQGHFRVRS